MYSLGKSVKEQLQSERNLSSPGLEQRAAWRTLLETAYSVFDFLADEMQKECGMSIRWYDVLLHLEELPGGRLRMGDLAARILLSKSGLTRLIDQMEEAGFVRREQPRTDRRALEVVVTPAGLAALESARRIHRDGIERHFARYLSDEEATTLRDALETVHRETMALRLGKGPSQATERSPDGLVQTEETS
jgi:DNA-binding MarR family transcriptional regulator